MPLAASPILPVNDLYTDGGRHRLLRDPDAAGRLHPSADITAPSHHPTPLLGVGRAKLYVQTDRAPGRTHAGALRPYIDPDRTAHSRGRLDVCAEQPDGVALTPAIGSGAQVAKTCHFNAKFSKTLPDGSVGSIAFTAEPVDPTSIPA
jgi:hypothetical protein